VALFFPQSQVYVPRLTENLSAPTLSTVVDRTGRNGAGSQGLGTHHEDNAHQRKASSSDQHSVRAVGGRPTSLVGDAKEDATGTPVREVSLW